MEGISQQRNSFFSKIKKRCIGKSYKAKEEGYLRSIKKRAVEKRARRKTQED